MGVALIDAVVHHGGQQVVGCADGMQVAGEVQVDVLHGHHLGVAAAGRAALYAEHGAQAGLTQAEHGLFAQGIHCIGQAHAGGGFALARGGGADGRYQNQLALLVGLLKQAMVDLGLVLAVQADLILGETQLFGNLGDGLHLGSLGDFDVTLHSNYRPFPYRHRVGFTPRLTCLGPAYAQATPPARPKIYYNIFSGCGQAKTARAKRFRRLCQRAVRRTGPSRINVPIVRAKSTHPDA